MNVKGTGVKVFMGFLKVLSWNLLGGTEEKPRYICDSEAEIRIGNISNINQRHYELSQVPWSHTR
jgi:hypothetical protein